jgi:hypothetical protein
MDAGQRDKLFAWVTKNQGSPDLVNRSFVRAVETRYSWSRIDQLHGGYVQGAANSATLSGTFLIPNEGVQLNSPVINGHLAVIGNAGVDIADLLIAIAIAVGDLQERGTVSGSGIRPGEQPNARFWSCLILQSWGPPPNAERPFNP